MEDNNPVRSFKHLQLLLFGHAHTSSFRFDEKGCNYPRLGKPGGDNHTMNALVMLGVLASTFRQETLS